MAGIATFPIMAYIIAQPNPNRRNWYGIPALSLRQQSPSYLHTYNGTRIIVRGSAPVWDLMRSYFSCYPWYGIYVPQALAAVFVAGIVFIARALRLQVHY